MRIALVDDHALFRKGMQAILGGIDDMEVVLEADHGQDFLDQLKDTPVDVVLMDLEMPEMDGMEATKILRSDYPDVRVLILSMHSDEKFIIKLMELGAHGYLLKTAQPDEIEVAIRSTMESGYYFTELVSKVMLHGLVQRKKVQPTFNTQAQLSQREQEVLLHICKELTTPEIAEALFLSPRTVEGHRNNLMQKTGAKNTAGLVVYAIKNGHFDPEAE